MKLAALVVLSVLLVLPSCKPTSPGDDGASVDLVLPAELPVAKDALTPLRREGDPAVVPDPVRTASGLTYAVAQKGRGSPPFAGTEVRIHYTAWVRQGDKLGRSFTDSRATGHPEAFVLASSGVGSSDLDGGGFQLDKPPQPLALPGLVECVRTMQQGERRWVLLPAALAYGEKGLDGVVKPNADVVFDIELISYGPR